MNLQTRLRAAAMVTLVAASPLAAHADLAVTIDPVQTSASFTLSHFAFSKVSGSIPIKDATMTLNDDAVPTAVQVHFDIAKLTTQDDQRDSDLRSDHFFDVANDPDMSFDSTNITPGKNGAFTIVGNLTMHGVTKPVTLSGNLEKKTTDAKGTHLDYRAGTSIDRTQWNVGNYPAVVIGTSVAITIELEATAK